MQGPPTKGNACKASVDDREDSFQAEKLSLYVF